MRNATPDSLGFDNNNSALGHPLMMMMVMGDWIAEDYIYSNEDGCNVRVVT